MAEDSGSTTLLSVAVFIAVCEVFNIAWAAIQAWDYIREKLAPPETKDTFDGGKSLMLEEVYNATKVREAHASEDDHIRIKIEDMHGKVKDLHLWHSKEDEAGRKIWFIPGKYLEKIQETAQLLNTLVRNG